MLAEHDKTTLALFARRLRSHVPEARIWAFGSRARGDASDASDFDVCVVLPTRDSDTLGLVDGIAWEVGFENDRVMTTIIYSFDEFANGPCAQSPLVKRVLSEGVAA